MSNSEDRSGTSSLTSRYLAGFLASAVITGVQQLAWPYTACETVSRYFLVVLFFAWHGGLGWGRLSVSTSFFLPDLFFIEPFFFFWLPKQLVLVRLLLFAVIGRSISVMTELLPHIGDALPATKVKPRLGGMELCKT